MIWWLLSALVAFVVESEAQSIEVQKISDLPVQGIWIYGDTMLALGAVVEDNIWKGRGLYISADGQQWERIDRAEYGFPEAVRWSQSIFVQPFYRSGKVLIPAHRQVLLYDVHRRQWQRYQYDPPEGDTLEQQLARRRDYIDGFITREGRIYLTAEASKELRRDTIDGQIVIYVDSYNEIFELDLAAGELVRRAQWILEDVLNGWLGFAEDPEGRVWNISSDGVLTVITPEGAIEFDRSAPFRPYGPNSRCVGCRSLIWGDGELIGAGYDFLFAYQPLQKQWRKIYQWEPRYSNADQLYRAYFRWFPERRELWVVENHLFSATVYRFRDSVLLDSKQLIARQLLSGVGLETSLGTMIIGEDGVFYWPTSEGLYTVRLLDWLVPSAVEEPAQQSDRPLQLVDGQRIKLPMVTPPVVVEGYDLQGRQVFQQVVTTGDLVLPPLAGGIYGLVVRDLDGTVRYQQWILLR